MSAYFSLTFEVNKTSNVIKNFYNALINSGLIFKSGYFESKDDTYEDIVEWNQKKLDDDFVLGYKEHCSNDYKQLLFNYYDFSEVRLFIMNHREKSSFTFELIVPEEDLIEYEKENTGNTEYKIAERMEYLKYLAKQVWMKDDVLAIQSGWENSDVPPYAEEIEEGARPQLEPFCIINSLSNLKEPGWMFESTEKNGVFIENTEHWYNKLDELVICEDKDL